MATFRKRGSNWQVQVRVQGQNAISRSFTFKTDAERWAREAEASIERNDFQSPAKELQTVSLDEKLERYERVVTAKKKGRASEAYRLTALRRHPISRLMLQKLPAHGNTPILIYRAVLVLDWVHGLDRERSPLHFFIAAV